MENMCQKTVTKHSRIAEVSLIFSFDIHHCVLGSSSLSSTVSCACWHIFRCN